MTKLNDYLQKNILPELDRGRANFDRLHTEAVVFWLGKIVDNTPQLSLDREVLMIAAYAHDLGYAGLFRDGNQPQYKEVQQAKINHMRLGSERLREFLRDPVFAELSEERKNRCVHLVAVHDKFKELEAEDELVLMEADTFGGLDVDFVKPTFDFESNQKYIEEVRANRLPRFLTEFSKQNIEAQIERRLEYYRSHKV